MTFTSNKGDGLRRFFDRIEKKKLDGKMENQQSDIDFLKEQLLQNLKIQEEQKKQIEEFKIKVESSRRTYNKKELSLKQQILTMHYLGLLNSIEELDLTGENKGKLVSLIIDKSPKNTTTDLSHLNTITMKDSDIFTVDNLEKVSKYFGLLGLDKHIEQINKDLLKLK